MYDTKNRGEHRQVVVTNAHDNIEEVRGVAFVPG